MHDPAKDNLSSAAIHSTKTTCSLPVHPVNKINSKLQQNNNKTKELKQVNTSDTLESPL